MEYPARGLNVMPTILVPNTVMVTMVFVQFSQRQVNTFHVLCPGAPTPADLVAIKNVFVAWDRNSPLVATNLAAQRSINATLVQVSCVSLHAVGAPVLDYLLPIQ